MIKFKDGDLILYLTSSPKLGTKCQDPLLVPEYGCMHLTSRSESVTLEGGGREGEKNKKETVVYKPSHCCSRVHRVLPFDFFNYLFLSELVVNIADP